MGLFNVLKLANDYNKAKKFIETKIADKKVDLEKAKGYLEKLKKFSDILKDIKKEVNKLIALVQDYRYRIEEIIKAKEEDDEEVIA